MSIPWLLQLSCHRYSLMCLFLHFTMSPGEQRLWFFFFFFFISVSSHFSSLRNQLFLFSSVNGYFPTWQSWLANLYSVSGFEKLNWTMTGRNGWSQKEVRLQGDCVNGRKDEAKLEVQVSRGCDETCWEAERVHVDPLQFGRVGFRVNLTGFRVNLNFY